MTRLDVTSTIEIDRDPRTVRQQFGDVAHHEHTNVHHGVRFEVIDDDGTRCRYRQTTRLGPLRVHQELQLARTEEGPLVNTVLTGQFNGGTISFDIEPVAGAEERSRVRARLVTELHGASALVAPLLRRSVIRALNRALTEDRRDLEQHCYGRPPLMPCHPMPAEPPTTGTTADAPGRQPAVSTGTQHMRWLR